MADTWDDFVETERSRRPAPPVEVVLWTLRKGARTAEARVRPHALGQELRFLYNDDLLWSEVFRPGRGVVLGEVADAKRRELEEREWRTDV